ncbi:hypothetical protein CXG81DRAFT_17244 [Caulochytrium protostelioides]|uniref:Uncharacterized protein n=1 Tax=Caulochytrium protostelioides TaxID=1555241 RepID=A0A4P9XCM4_9FUNG|nr:hypothetical protein CXG81DRAFT_17244 [Caulochytrium protostelioides]|eukprot:RKP03183.1 hypothetical protein CXG81DRAFT_17244 [Caulochytrium protostelioides]
MSRTLLAGLGVVLLPTSGLAGAGPVAPATLPRLLPRGQPSSDAAVDRVAWIVESGYVRGSDDFLLADAPTDYVRPKIVKVSSPDPEQVKVVVTNDPPSGNGMQAGGLLLEHFLDEKGREIIFGTDDVDVMFDALNDWVWWTLHQIWRLVPDGSLKGLRPLKVQQHLDFVVSIQYALYQLCEADKAVKQISSTPGSLTNYYLHREFVKKQGHMYSQYLDLVDITNLNTAGILHRLVANRPGLEWLQDDLVQRDVTGPHRSPKELGRRLEFQKQILFNSIVSNELSGYLHKLSSNPPQGGHGEVHAKPRPALPTNIQCLVTLRMLDVMGRPNFKQALEDYEVRHGVLNGGVLVPLGVVDQIASPDSRSVIAEGGTAKIPLPKEILAGLDELWLTGLEQLVGKVPWADSSGPDPTRSAPGLGQSIQPRVVGQGNIQASEELPLSSRLKGKGLKGKIDHLLEVTKGSLKNGK